MNFQEEILINKFGQDLIDQEEILNYFNSLENDIKKDFLSGLVELIFQSKPQLTDIAGAIEHSKLKMTYTPCVLINKGFTWGNFQQIIDLPESERKKTFILFINLFRIAYQRRFQLEKNSPQKWWYWDLTDKENMKKIMNRSND